MDAIIYFSQSGSFKDQQALDTLLLLCNTKNKVYDITGYLYYRNNCFFQYIEGDAENLRIIYTKIKNDKRHTILSEIYEQDLNQRRFPNWSMKKLFADEYPAAEIDLENLLLDYFQQKKFLEKIGSPSAQDWNQRVLRLIGKIAAATATEHSADS